MKPIKFTCKGQVKNAFWNYAVLEHFTVSKHNVETFFNKVERMPNDNYLILFETNTFPVIP